MSVKDGIQVDLEDSAGSPIRAIDGCIVAAPGEEFEICITIYNNFKWFATSCLYVEIASRDGNGGRQHDWDGDETQVLCIQKTDANSGVIRISKMKLWDIHETTENATKKPFLIPSPQPEPKRFGAVDDKPPALQARRGCIQVSFVRGRLPAAGRTFKRRTADPRDSQVNIAQLNEAYQHVNPKWFKQLAGDKGDPITFEFQNMHGETKAVVKKEPGLMETQAQHAAPPAIMQSPAAVIPKSSAANSHFPQKQWAIPLASSRRRSSALNTMPGAFPQKQWAASRAPSTRRSSALNTTPPRSMPGTMPEEPVSPEAGVEDEDRIVITTPTTARLTVSKRSKEESSTTRKLPVVVTPRRVSSKRVREPRTPSPASNGSSLFISAHASPSASPTMTPMSSQKKRKVQLLELKLQEVRLERQIFELSNED
ncbi:uncharacterized protein RCC_09523 [Ramularia collo-cygni]|uniref:Uncharacterized protein n=1 Tax=Ramularia collo-cygni TaxID=112498 RepID=A0A2D3VK99_9PEZI|nr:uncharacterized protein RCC_09523 [Ramularia collo-cygni]CZT23809.1 uncharacterized protein RCC_09523 [Ramularia collo-cygni]